MPCSPFANLPKTAGAWRRSGRQVPPAGVERGQAAGHQPLAAQVIQPDRYAVVAQVGQRISHVVILLALAGQLVL
jgi:hypothetical protein